MKNPFSPSISRISLKRVIAARDMNRKERMFYKKDVPSQSLAKISKSWLVTELYFSYSSPARFQYYETSHKLEAVNFNKDFDFFAELRTCVSREPD